MHQNPENIVSEIKRFQKGSHSYTKWDKKTKEVRKVNQEEKPISIKVEPNEQKGVYANFALVSHTKEEFIFDLILVVSRARQSEARLVSRVIMSPAHAKRFVHAIAENIKRYEKTFGDVSPSSEKKIGF